MVRKGLKRVLRPISGYTTKKGKKVPPYKANRHIKQKPARRVRLPDHPSTVKKDVDVLNKKFRELKENKKKIAEIDKQYEEMRTQREALEIGSEERLNISKKMTKNRQTRHEVHQFTNKQAALAYLDWTNTYGATPSSGRGSMSSDNYLKFLDSYRKTLETQKGQITNPQTTYSGDPETDALILSDINKNLAEIDAEEVRALTTKEDEQRTAAYREALEKRRRQVQTEINTIDEQLLEAKPEDKARLKGRKALLEQRLNPPVSPPQQRIARQLGVDPSHVTLLDEDATVVTPNQLLLGTPDIDDEGDIIYIKHPKRKCKKKSRRRRRKSSS